MKNKVHPATCHEDSEGKQMYISTLSLSCLLKGIGGQRHAKAALPLGKGRGAHRTRGWVGPKDDLDGCEKSRQDRDSIPGPSSS